MAAIFFPAYLNIDKEYSWKCPAAHISRWPSASRRSMTVTNTHRCHLEMPVVNYLIHRSFSRLNQWKHPCFSWRPIQPAGLKSLCRIQWRGCDGPNGRWPQRSSTSPWKSGPLVKIRCSSSGSYPACLWKTSQTWQIPGNYSKCTCSL